MRSERFDKWRLDFFYPLNEITKKNVSTLFVFLLR